MRRHCGRVNLSKQVECDFHRLPEYCFPQSMPILRRLSPPFQCFGNFVELSTQGVARCWRTATTRFALGYSLSGLQPLPVGQAKLGEIASATKPDPDESVQPCECECAEWHNLSVY